MARSRKRYGRSRRYRRKAGIMTRVKGVATSLPGMIVLVGGILLAAAIPQIGDKAKEIVSGLKSKRHDS